MVISQMFIAYRYVLVSVLIIANYRELSQVNYIKLYREVTRSELTDRVPGAAEHDGRHGADESGRRRRLNEANIH